MKRLSPWLNGLFFLLMVTVNALAEWLPIAGVTTGEVSAKYPTLITPAPYAFAIWGVIYLGLAAFCLWQAGCFGGGGRGWASAVLPWFPLSCLCNAAWLVLWHYERLGWAVVVLAALLVCLIALWPRLSAARGRDRWLVFVPFGLYLGWASVATIVGVAAWLTSLGWQGGPLLPAGWAALMALVAGGLSLAALWRGNWPFSVAVCWALGAILVRQGTDYAWQYPVILWAVAAALAVQVAALPFVWRRLGEEH